ncbi:MAG TPA: fibronectin type III domain-containing protein, partial [Chloroflexota bacterium]|nr:fibronectin type III domain-containing protein [Chloroflexota bacterium]
MTPGRGPRPRALTVWPAVAAIALLSLSFAGPGSAATSAAVPKLQPGSTIYVSPVGNDQNPGTLAQPVQTIARAQQMVRGIDRNMTGNITVYLEAGTYRMTRPLQLGPGDSGSYGFDVVWMGAPGAHVVISGGEKITGWKLSDPSKNIWAAPIPAGLATRQIYINGVRASLAAGPSPVRLERFAQGYYETPSSMAHWRNRAGIEFVYPSQLSYPAEPICPVASIKGRLITMAQPCWDNSNLRKHNLVGWGSGFLFIPAYVENAYELLDEPGQFYLDPTAHMLYYIPRPGEDLRNADVEAPTLQTLVSGQGTASRPVHNIAFENIQFSFATWMQPSTRVGFSEEQSGYTVTTKGGYATQGLCKVVPHGTCPFGSWTKEPGNLEFSFDRNITFSNDRFVHLGAAGLNLDNGSQSDTVVGSVFTDISGNGLEIGNVNLPGANGASQTRWITVRDNHLYAVPAEYEGGVAVLVGYAANTVISHNQIDHTPCMALSIGWGGWLDKLRQPPVPNFSHDNVISDNLIFDYMQVLKDGGGIYTQGIEGSSLKNGMKITGNVIHDQLDWGGALKADNGTAYVTYTGNVLYNNTYDWDGTHWDYRAHPGTTHPRWYDPEVLHGNWWQQGDQNYSYRGVTVSGNTIITGASQAPLAVVRNAGLQPGFNSVLNWRPNDSAVPNRPEEVSILYAFQRKAYVTWHPSYVEGRSPVDTYTITVCRLMNSLSGTCAQPSPPSVTVPAAQLDRAGYTIVSGLTSGVRYTISVSARNDAGSSLQSLPSATFSPTVSA